MSKYIEILARQRPSIINVDLHGHLMFSCNFDAKAQAPVEKLEEEMAKIISNAGLGVLGTTIFVGPNAQIPTAAGPYITIIDTGGLPPEETHDDSVYERLTFQVVVSGTSFHATRTRALAIWRALDGLRNTTVTA